MKTMVRQVQGEEMHAALYALNSYSFHDSPPLVNQEEWIKNVKARQGVTCFAFFEGDDPVSIAASTAMKMNIRGKEYKASGVWGVATKPEARRKNYCRAVMSELLSSARDTGQAFSNLYPFRESFYERLGYAADPLTRIAHLATSALAPILDLKLCGEIDQQLIGPGYSLYREYLDGMRSQRHGMACFEFGDQAAANRNLHWIASAKFDHRVEGLMLYRLQGEEVTKFKFTVISFYYATIRARYLLLNWIARHVDQAEKVELWLASDETPENWWSDLGIHIESAVRPAMTRVLDVANLSGMPVGEGSFTAVLVDPVCPWNSGTWEFKAADNHLVVAPAAAGQCHLTIQGLSALIAGTVDPALLSLRGWGSMDEKLQAIVRKMFPGMVPYMHEMF